MSVFSKIGHKLGEAFHAASGSKALAKKDRGAQLGGFSRAEIGGLGLGLGVGATMLVATALGPATIALAAAAAVTASLIPARIQSGIHMVRDNREKKAMQEKKAKLKPQTKAQHKLNP